MAGCLLCITAAGFAWHFGSPYFYIWQARKLLLTNPAAAALLLEQEVLATSDSIPEAEVLWSHALLRSGRWAEALGAFSQIKSPETAAPASLLKLAKEAVDKKADPLARLALNAIKSEATERRGAVEILMGIAERDGAFVAVLELADELDHLAPQSYQTSLMRARALEQLMDLPAAAIAYQKVLESSVKIEDTVRILRSLVRIYIQLARQAEAREFQNRLLKMNEGEPLADDQFNEARLRRLEGDIAGAGRSLEQVLNLGMNGAEVLELRATLAMDEQDYQAAVSDLQNVLSEQPWNKQAHYKLAQALTKCGRSDEAQRHLRENRRLLELSNRIVLLGKKTNRTAEETDELVRAMEESGMKVTAAQVKQRSQDP